MPEADTPRDIRALERHSGYWTSHVSTEYCENKCISTREYHLLEYQSQNQQSLQTNNHTLIGWYSPLTTSVQTVQTVQTANTISTARNKSSWSLSARDRERELQQRAQCWPNMQK